MNVSESRMFAGKRLYFFYQIVKTVGIFSSVRGGLMGSGPLHNLRDFRVPALRLFYKCYFYVSVRLFDH